MSKHNGLSEDELCGLLADAVRSSADFRAWFLGRTKFAGYARTARLLHEEQLALGVRKQWWRHWWSFVPALGRERETDIFMVFEAPSTLRFALHIEAKLGTGSFQPGQAQGYGPGAAHMSNTDRYLNYTDYQTVLVSTRRFREAFPDDVRCFDVSLSFNEIAPFLTQFVELEST